MTEQISNSAPGDAWVTIATLVNPRGFELVLGILLEEQGIEMASCIHTGQWLHDVGVLSKDATRALDLVKQYAAACECEITVPGTPSDNPMVEVRLATIPASAKDRVSEILSVLNDWSIITRVESWGPDKTTIYVFESDAVIVTAHLKSTIPDHTGIIWYEDDEPTS